MLTSWRTKKIFNNQKNFEKKCKKNKIPKNFHIMKLRNKYKRTKTEIGQARK